MEVKCHSSIHQKAMSRTPHKTANALTRGTKQSILFSYKLIENWAGFFNSSKPRAKEKKHTSTRPNHGLAPVCCFPANSSLSLSYPCPLLNCAGQAHELLQAKTSPSWLRATRTTPIWHHYKRRINLSSVSSAFARIYMSIWVSDSILERDEVFRSACSSYS